MPKVVGLFTYPIKSLSGISLSESQVQIRGLEFDRRWMLVEADGTFITQRDDPSLVRFQVRLLPEGLEVSAPGSGSCFVPFLPSHEAMQVRVWKSDVVGNVVRPKIDTWFSTALGRPCHLVKMAAEAYRPINENYGDHPVSFADAMPVLVLSESSLADLNERLETPVPIDRFRANIVLEGTEPYAEDETEGLTIRGVPFRSTKRCGRCLVTCTDQQTGERGTEPLRTLAAYRLYNQNACMGMYFVPEAEGIIRVGDTVSLAPTATSTLGTS